MTGFSVNIQGDCDNYSVIVTEIMARYNSQQTCHFKVAKQLKHSDNDDYCANSILLTFLHQTAKLQRRCVHGMIVPVISIFASL